MRYTGSEYKKKDWLRADIALFNLANKSKLMSAKAWLTRDASFCHILILAAKRIQLTFRAHETRHRRGRCFLCPDRMRCLRKSKAYFHCWLRRIVDRYLDQFHRQNWCKLLMRDKLNIVVSYLTNILIETIIKALIKIKLWKLMSKDISKAF